MWNAGKVVPTETILSKIRGYDSDAETNVVWTYVSYLRKKLAALTDRVEIEAVHGVGLSLARSIVTTHRGKIVAKKDGDTVLFIATICKSPKI